MYQSKGYFAGIDSGGTKCEVIICNEKRNLIFGKAYKGVHYSITGAENYSKIVSGMLKTSCRKTGLSISALDGICFGIAGARERKDRLALKRLLKKYTGITNVLVTTDAMTALYGAFEGEEGIILISGTGSVLYGYTNTGKFRGIKRVGGWGRILGDEGSGYWIGRKALNLISKEFDKLNSESLLSKEINKRFNINPFNVNEKIFRKNFEIQKLAPVVIECAELNCTLSNEIIREAVDGLMYHINTYLNFTKRKTPMQIAFIGSIIENENLLSSKLKKEISKIKILNVVKKKHSPALGAALIAMDNPDYLSKL
ncbi:MAG: N-acetylmuramic acid/N-acetylglucosamine kinase [Ignavibacteria bacterium]|nr:N-acetylmuramic acid/N-acetylglucosamine kinase [Ignavibacteria bacterium]